MTDEKPGEPAMEVEVPAFLLKPAPTREVIAEIAKARKLLCELNNVFGAIAAMGIKIEIDNAGFLPIGGRYSRPKLIAAFTEEREL